MSNGAIAGIVIGVVGGVLLLCCILAICFLVVIPRRSKPSGEHTEAAGMEGKYAQQAEHSQAEHSQAEPSTGGGVEMAEIQNEAAAATVGEEQTV